MSNWFVVKVGTEHGPFTSDQLRQMAASGQIQSSTSIRRSDSQAVVSASQIPGIFTSPPPLPSSSPILEAEVVSPRPVSVASDFWTKNKTLCIIVGSLVGMMGLFTMSCCGCVLMVAGSGAGDVDSFSSASGNTVSETETPIRVSPNQLVNDYASNGVAAEKRYKGNVVEVTGVVSSVDRDALGIIYVTLKAGGEFDFTEVQCYFGDEHRERAARVRPGRFVTIRGRVSGKIFHVMVNNCRFAD